MRSSNSYSDNRKSKTRTEQSRSIQNRKWAGFLAILILAAGPAGDMAPQPAKIRPIGYVSGTGDPSNPWHYVEWLWQGLRDLGYTEGKNFMFECRGAEGRLDRIPSLVA